MKLPWVSRGEYRARVDSYHADLNSAIDRAHMARRDAEEWKARYEALLAKYHEAVTPKIVSATMVAVPEAPVKKKRESIVQQAIRDEAGSDQRLAAYYRKRASDLRREGKSDADIVEAIHSWQTTEPGAEQVNE